MKVYMKGTTHYIVSKCPNCGKIYRKEPTYSAEHFGSPLVQCKSCGKYMIDNFTTEMALKPKQWYIDRQYKEPNLALKILAYAWLPLLFIGLMVTGNKRVIEEQTVLFVFALIGWAIGIAVLKYKGVGNKYVINADFEKQYEESARRLADPAYRQILEKAGYKFTQ